MASVLARTLRPELVRLGLEATTKPEAIDELLGILDAAGLLPNREAAAVAVRAREEELSTGLHDGVAIPHAKVVGLTDLVAAVAVKREGLDFDSVDGEPARLFILMLCPPGGTSAHIEFMSEIGGLMRQPTVRDRLLKAETPHAVVKIMTQS